MKRRLRLLATLAVLPAVLLLVISCQQPGTALAATTGSIALEPTAITYTGNYVAWNGTLNASVAITNLLSGSTTISFDVVFHETSSSTFNPSTDPVVGTISVSGIGSNTTVSKNATLTMPSAPSSGTNEDVYIYAVVDPTNATGQTTTSNDISTLSNAAIVLAYDSSVSPGSYNVVVETYGTTGGSSNPGISLFKYVAGTTPTLSHVQNGAAVSSGSNTYNSLDFTASGVLGPLSSGTYYLAVFPVSGSGAYAVNVRSPNVTSPTFTALTADPTGVTNIVSSSSSTMVVGGSNYNTYTTPVPTIAQSITVGNAQNWYLNGSDLGGTDATEWFAFTLP